MSNLFLGYSDLDELLAHYPYSSSALYCMLITESGPADSKFGVSLDRTKVIVQLVDQGLVRYWQMHLGAVQMVAGSPLSDERAEKVQARARSAYELIKERLQARGIIPEHALVAMPKNLKQLDGQASFLRYHKESDQFLPMAEGNREATAEVS